jgi:hypothetical protein
MQREVANAEGGCTIYILLTGNQWGQRVILDKANQASVEAWITLDESAINVKPQKSADRG